MTIRLFLSPTTRLGPDGMVRTWIADFGADPEMRKLFGTTSLPTPYTDLTPADMVLAKVRELNPGVVVYLLDDDDPHHEWNDIYAEIPHR